MQEQIKQYKFTYHHINHSIFTGTITAINESNRDCQMLSLLFSRYRRKLPLKGMCGVVDFEEI